MHATGVTLVRDDEAMHGVVPDRVTMDMSIHELAAIAAVFGRINGIGQSKLFLAQDDEVYLGAVSIINAFYENGVHDIAPMNFELTTLNAERA